jgi:hypothetical protein
MLWRVRNSRGKPINAPAAFIHPCQPIVSTRPPRGAGWRMNSSMTAIGCKSMCGMAGWESGVAGPCQVDWHVRTTGADVAGLQGSFKLETNRANPVV